METRRDTRSLWRSGCRMSTSATEQRVSKIGSLEPTDAGSEFVKLPAAVTALPVHSRCARSRAQVLPPGRGPIVRHPLRAPPPTDEGVHPRLARELRSA